MAETMTSYEAEKHRYIELWQGTFKALLRVLEDTRRTQRRRGRKVNMV